MCNGFPYCEDCAIVEPAGEGEFIGGVCAYATDPGQAARLWKLSAAAAPNQGPLMSSTRHAGSGSDVAG